jgi:threonine/homoserine/homoserine lactone efflux protein|tara:strand:+ start:434 stop:1042 length:609 start_codon:yes stop_codon:yes gene_type:complete
MTLIFWLQFVAVCIAGAMSPGPSLALIIRNSTKYNRLGGIMSAIGHGLGMGIYAIFAVTGLIIILTTNIYIFKSIQIAGIIFLFIFGILFIIQKNEELNIENNQNKLNSFFQGFSISILNPKILIWFSAVFSQFVRSDSTFLTNSILVITASAIDCIWYVVVALIVTSYGLKDFFQKRINAIQKISGTVLVLISILLIINFF